MTEPRRSSDLYASLDKLAQETRDLSETYAQAEDTRRKKTTVMLGILAVATIFVALTFALLVKVVLVAREIDSCTNPTGQCYLDQRARTGGAITRILRGQVITEECARVSRTDAELEACVKRRFAAEAGS